MDYEEFSLECSDCDDGVQYRTQEDAEAAGWIDITPDPSGYSWNHLGLCPLCKAAMDAMDSMLCDDRQDEPT